jgi:hypothetical protein
MSFESWGFVIGASAAVIGFILWIVEGRARRILAILGSIGVLVLVSLAIVRAHHKPSALDARFSTESGVSTLSDLLDAMSRGGITVMLDPVAEQQLRPKTVKVRTPRLQDTPYRDVLDNVLLPQLSPFGKWTYRVSGNVITIERR